MIIKEYFSDKELRCSCGCGEMNINSHALEKLYALRHLFGNPITLSSAFRCKAHNKKIGGKPQSGHLTGEAFDIKVTNENDRKILDIAVGLGFNGIGIANTFIHVDTKERVAVWTY